MEALIIILAVSVLYFIIPSKKELNADEWDLSDIDGGTYGQKIMENITPVKKKTRKRASKKVIAKKLPKKSVKKKPKVVKKKVVKKRKTK